MSFSYVVLTFFTCTVIKYTNTAFTIKERRITAEYGGVTILRCSVVPHNLSIETIEWRKGVGFRSSIYFDNLSKPGQRQRRGTFKNRVVTGNFLQGNSSYDLKINRTIPDDVDNYTCLIQTRTENGLVSSSPIRLVLVAPPDESPSITDICGVKQHAYNCSDESNTPFVILDKEQSFVCSVGGARPFPSVQWNGGNNTLIYDISYSKEYRNRGTHVKSVRQKIDVYFPINAILTCTVTIPDPTSGQLRRVFLCLRVIRGAADPTNVLFMLIPVAGFMIFLLAFVTIICVSRANINIQTSIFVNVFFIAEQVFIGMIMIFDTYRTCLYNMSFEGYEQIRRPNGFLLFFVSYFILRVILSIFLWKRKKCHHTIWTVTINSIMAVAYVCGLIWNYKTGNCYWNNGSLLALVLMAYMGCSIWAYVSLREIRKSNRKDYGESQTTISFVGEPLRGVDVFAHNVYAFKNSSSKKGYTL